MTTEFQPRIGDWYVAPGGDNFEVVAVDEDEGTVEIQYFDGAIEELDLEAWADLDLTAVEPPEDWSGSLDMEREDYGVDLEESPHDPYANPLDQID